MTAHTDSWPVVELPFPLRRNPHADRVRPRTRQWAIDMGMLPTSAACRWWDHVDLTALEAWCFPDAPADRLLLIDKWLSLGIMFDDQFDSTSLGRRLDVTCRVLNHMMTAIEHPPSEPVTARHPFSRAMADLLADFARLMSPVWLRRHRHHLTLWWGGVIQATAHRARSGPPLPFTERLKVRRLTVGMHAYGDLFEAACDWEIPPAVFALPEIQCIRRIITDITVFLNDLYSVERERVDGNDDNVLLAWEAEGHSPHTARTAAADRITKLAEEFTTLSRALPQLAESADLTMSDRTGLRHWADTCALYLAGAGYSQAIIPRYTDTTSHLAHDHRLDRALQVPSTEHPPGR
ncbi:hypothetical protein ACFQ2B_36160 [Streptomyces stramineus]|uniref:Terpene synthase n=1 Tax=Streptomyces stramineus TaxID=173861 RepID=A0ABP3J612_9ACTN